MQSDAQDRGILLARELAARVRELEQRIGMLTEMDEWLAKIRTQPLRSAVSAGVSLEDLDGDTKVQVEESSDEDKIRMDTGGTERGVLDSTALALVVPLKADTISEKTPAAGVTVDGLLLKDGNCDGRDVSADGTLLDSRAAKALSDLASVAINTSLISDADSTDDLGSSTKYWANVYADKLYLNATATLDGATPGKVALTGNLDVSGHGEFGAAPGGIGETILDIGGSSTANPAIGYYGLSTGIAASGVQMTVGLYGGAVGAGTPAASLVYGLFFQANHNTSSVCGGLAPIYIQQQSWAGGTGAITTGRGIYLVAAAWIGSKPATVCGFDIEEQGHADVPLAFGLRIADQTATTVRLLELGPATPYLRLLGGGDPAAGDTNLYLKVGGSLMQVWSDGGTLKVK